MSPLAGIAHSGFEIAGLGTVDLATARSVTHCFESPDFAGSGRRFDFACHRQIAAVALGTFLHPQEFFYFFWRHSA